MFHSIHHPPHQGLARYVTYQYNNPNSIEPCHHLKVGRFYHLPIFTIPYNVDFKIRARRGNRSIQDQDCPDAGSARRSGLFSPDKAEAIASIQEVLGSKVNKLSQACQKPECASMDHEDREKLLGVAESVLSRISNISAAIARAHVAAQDAVRAAESLAYTALAKTVVAQRAVLTAQDAVVVAWEAWK